MPKPNKFDLELYLLINSFISMLIAGVFLALSHWWSVFDRALLYPLVFSLVCMFLSRLAPIFSSWKSSIE